MDDHDRLLVTFLAGELDSAAARRWDEHLLACEHCWRAVREDRAGRQAAGLLRQPASPGLADRVAFAVEVAAADRTRQRQARPPGRSQQVRTGRWLSWPRLAGAATLAAGLAITLLVLLPGGHQADTMPAAVAAVARYAQDLPPPSGNARPAGATPVQVGHPVTVTAGGQQIVMRTWRLGGVQAVVAVSARPFPTPARAHGLPGPGMAWTARSGPVSLYCLNGKTSELVAAPLPSAELATLAARLPPA